MMAYGVLYASASDARWHEAGHGTAFRTDWMNDALYEVASFMVLRESVPWRWSHTRHHSDTIIVGRDPEIAVPRPPDLREMFLKCFNYRAWRRYVTNITLHCLGRVTPIEATFIPPSEYPKVYLRARIYAAILLAMVAAVRVLPHVAAVGVRARPQRLRRVADGGLRLDAARGARRERARSSAQLPDDPT